METNGFDAGAISVAAAAFFMACIALGSWLRTRRRQSAPATNETAVLAQIRSQLRTADASIAQLKSVVERQQSALETTITTLESIRRSADDHASDVKTGIDAIAGAIDAARAEAAERDKSATKRIDDVRNIAAEAQENANNAFLTVNSLRRTVDEIERHIAGIPELRGDIGRLQQTVAAAAEATPKPQAQPPAGPTGKKPPRNGRRRGARARKAAEEKARAGKEAATAATQPAGKPDTDDAGPAGYGETRTDAAPTGEPPTATGTPDPSSTTADNEAPDAGENVNAGAPETADAAGNGAVGGATPAQTGKDAEQSPHTSADAPGAAKQSEATG